MYFFPFNRFMTLLFLQLVSTMRLKIYELIYSGWYQNCVVPPPLAGRKHFLTALRRYRAHVLSEPVERVLEEKANTGARA